MLFPISPSGPSTGKAMTDSEEEPSRDETETVDIVNKDEQGKVDGQASNSGEKKRRYLGGYYFESARRCLKDVRGKPAEPSWR